MTRFMLSPDEMALLAKGKGNITAVSPSLRRARVGSLDQPSNWSEWVEHVLNHCPEHRLKEMPEEVEADYAKRVVSKAPPPVIKADEESDESDREVGETEEGDRYDTWFPRMSLLQ
jgi:hypothetical protein